MTNHPLGRVVYSFFTDYLRVQRGLRPSTIQSYRDAVRLFLKFVAEDKSRRITQLSLEDLTFDRVLRFLRYLEEERANHIRTRNQRLAVLHTFFEYVGANIPDFLAVAQRVAALPTKRVAPPETHYLERDEVQLLLDSVSVDDPSSLRDHTLLLFLYNTGARVQEVADLRIENLDLDPTPRVHLHGKGDKWRTCPLWQETAHELQRLMEKTGTLGDRQSPVFLSCRRGALTRSGIYKIVRRRAKPLEERQGRAKKKRVTPHVFRRTTAVHLLESDVEINVIRAWLGHMTLDTTNRYAEINAKAKEAALRKCEPPIDGWSEKFPRRPVWRDDETLLQWLDSM